MDQSRVFINRSLFDSTTQPRWPRCIYVPTLCHTVLSKSTLTVKMKSKYHKICTAVFSLNLKVHFKNT